MFMWGSFFSVLTNRIFLLAWFCIPLDVLFYLDLDWGDVKTDESSDGNISSLAISLSSSYISSSTSLSKLRLQMNSNLVSEKAKSSSTYGRWRSKLLLRVEYFLIRIYEKYVFMNMFKGLQCVNEVWSLFKSSPPTNQPKNKTGWFEAERKL